MKPIRLVAALLAFVVVIAITLAATTQAKKSQGAKGTKSVTGCLQKGDEADEYSITDVDGKTYGLRSSTVKLGDHLGHKVTVTGRLRPEREENEANESEGTQRTERKKGSG